MKKLLVLAFVSLASVLTGCVGNIQYGDFAPAESLVVEFIADDAVSQLAEIYPAAHTSFEMDPKSLGVLGAALETRMRDSGFAVSYTEGREFNYIFDVLTENRFRLTLDLEDSKFSRLYSSETTPQGTQIEAVSKWTVFNKEF